MHSQPVVPLMLPLCTVTHKAKTCWHHQPLFDLSTPSTHNKTEQLPPAKSFINNNKKRAICKTETPISKKLKTFLKSMLTILAFALTLCSALSYTWWDVCRSRSSWRVERSSSKMIAARPDSNLMACKQPQKIITPDIHIDKSRRRETVKSSESAYEVQSGELLWKTTVCDVRYWDRPSAELFQYISDRKVD